MADQNNPWDTTPAADSAAQSADARGTPATAPTDGGGADWLTSTPAPNVEHFNILDPFHKTLIPLDSWVTEGIDWVVTHFRPVFGACAFRLITSSTVSSNCCWVCPLRWRLSFSLSSPANFRCRNGRGDTGFADCHRRNRCPGHRQWLLWRWC